jgi:hypothetical protein
MITAEFTAEDAEDAEENQVEEDFEGGKGVVIVHRLVLTTFTVTGNRPQKLSNAVLFLVIAFPPRPPQ